MSSEEKNRRMLKEERTKSEMGRSNMHEWAKKGRGGEISTEREKGAIRGRRRGTSNVEHLIVSSISRQHSHCCI